MLAILNFIKALPELIEIFKALHNQAKAKGKAQLAKDDAKKLAKAIEEKDEKAIRDIFNS